MIKKGHNVIRFTDEELAAIKSIAEFDCGEVSCSECECAHTNTFRACFAIECKEILEDLDNRRL